MNARVTLFWIWIGAFVINAAICLAFLFQGRIVLENLATVFASTSGIFAPYLTTILVFWFSSAQTEKRLPRNVAKSAVPPPQSDDGAEKDLRTSALVAITCSVIFNTMVLVVLASVFTKREPETELVERTIETAGNIAKGMAFLVGPAIGFFFGKVVAARSGGQQAPVR